jgi:pimeloyl-ACP methyl ester carboxylesterase
MRNTNPVAITTRPPLEIHKARPTASRALSRTCGADPRRHGIGRSLPAPRSGRQTVVLLHSSAATARQWDVLAERLRPGFDVQAVDLHVDQLRARRPDGRPLSLQDDAALVLPIIERAGGVHLIGHCYGGALAMYLAAQWPSQVRSLAVYEPALFRLLADYGPQRAATREALGMADRVRSLMARGRAAAAAETFVDYWGGAFTWARLGPDGQRPLVSRMQTVMRQLDPVCTEALPSAQLAQLTMPVLCLSGAQSPAAASGIADLLRVHLPQAHHETLGGAGHMAPITHAQAVNDRLICFLGANVLLRSHAEQSRYDLGGRPDDLTSI